MNEECAEEGDDEEWYEHAGDGFACGRLAEDGAGVEEFGTGEGEEVAELGAKKDDAEEGAIESAVGEVGKVSEADTDEEECERGKADALEIAARFIGKD